MIIYSCATACLALYPDSMNTKIFSVLSRIRTHSDPPNRERMTCYEQRYRGGPRKSAPIISFIQEISTDHNILGKIWCHADKNTNYANTKYSTKQLLPKTLQKCHLVVTRFQDPYRLALISYDITRSTVVL